MVHSSAFLADGPPRLAGMVASAAGSAAMDSVEPAKLAAGSMSLCVPPAANWSSVSSLMKDHYDTCRSRSPFRLKRLSRSCVLPRSHLLQPLSSFRRLLLRLPPARTVQESTAILKLTLWITTTGSIWLLRLPRLRAALPAVYLSPPR
jgi:hypothetical protein